MSPRVSVVMGVYNSASTLKRAVDSILTQTLHDLEFIIIDDGSVDGSTEMLRSAAADDSRIQLIEQENRGLTQALIRGCALAKGPYIARQDADDWSYPERLERQAAVLDEQSNVGMVSSWVEYRGPGGELLEVLKRVEDPMLATQQLTEQHLGPPAHGAMMFRRSLYQEVGGYRPEFYFAQDSDLWLRMGHKSLIQYLPESLYLAQRDPASISGMMRPVQWQFGTLCKMCQQARDAGQSEEEYLTEARSLSLRVRELRSQSARQSEIAMHQMSYLIGSQLVRNRNAAARGYLWSVIRSRPWHWKAWLRLLQSYLMSPGSRGHEESSP